MCPLPTIDDDCFAPDRGLGDLAGRTGAHVQTHCSESDWAHAHVLERQGRTDAHALYAQHGFAAPARPQALMEIAYPDLYRTTTTAA